MKTKTTIPVRCVNCGNAVLAPRCDVDPPEAIEAVSESCDICWSGGFGTTWHVDRDGDDILGVFCDSYRDD